jgi:hypothetical protein
MSRKRRSVIQNHHIVYDPPWIVKIYKGEHWALTILNRRKRVSKGLIKALEYFIRQNRETAIDLES